jgi:hypothetical protein
MKRIVLILSSIFVIAILTSLILWWKNGDFSDYSSISAKRDIRKGNIRLLGHGLPVVTVKDNELDSIRAKYGFKSVNLGCTVSDEELRATNEYNRVVYEYLAKRNGKDWKINFQREIDSIYRIAFDTLYKIASKVSN